MTNLIQQAQNTFLFDFIKSEMIANNTTELSKDLLNAAYQKTVKFLACEDNIAKLKTITKQYIKNGK